MIELKNITKTYQLGKQSMTVLKGISLEIQTGEFVAIMGKSGSGKSTLMNMIGMLDVPTSGEYIFEQKNVENLTDNQQAQVRGEKIGFIFQSYNLLSRVPAFKQVALPLMYQGVKRFQQKKRAIEALEKVGLADKMHNNPNELSGGQQQRVAIARAIVTNPSIILADEPTGALDSKTGEDVMQTLVKLHQQGKTIVLITHDEKVASYAHRQIVLKDGLII